MAETNGARRRAPSPRGHSVTPARLASAAVLTTGQAAAVCGVAPRTVSKWFDAGLLRGYRLPACPRAPRGGAGDACDRRIPRADLAEFLVRNGMAVALARLGLGPDGTRLVALAGLVALEAGAVHSGLPAGWRCEAVGSLFGLGLLLGGVLDAVVVLDASLGRSDVLAAGAWLRGAMPGVRLVGLASEDDPGAWPGFDAVLRRPCGADAVLAAVKGEAP